MWYPTDESFFAAQAQENFARAQMAIASAHVANATVNATAASSGLLTSLHDVDPDVLASVGAVVLLVIWITLCGICRVYICCPCPCCLCYIPCCCGFCLKDDKEKENKKQSPNNFYHRHDHHTYPAKQPAAHGRHYYDHAEMPAYSSLTVDVEEPLLGPPAYSQPRDHEAPPPAYHNVPTAPSLS